MQFPLIPYASVQQMNQRLFQCQLPLSLLPPRFLRIFQPPSQNKQNGQRMGSIGSTSGLPSSENPVKFTYAT